MVPYNKDSIKEVLMKVFIGDPCYAMNDEDYFEMLSHSYWADDFDDGTINHPCIILSSSDDHDEEELEDAMIESTSCVWDDDGSFYPEIEGKVINAVKRCSTWIGDGVYGDQFDKGYSVASGQLGIVPAHMWKDDVSEERLNSLGRVCEIGWEDFFVYDKKASGTLQIAEFTIITGPADGNGDYIEEDMDS